MADIVQLLEKFRNDISRTLHVALPGKIEKYDYKTQKANIKIDLQELYKNGTTLDCPVIGGVPIMFPASGGAFFTMPVKRGDTCWIMFADRDITRWLFNGRGLPCESTRSHNLNDAVAIMGVHPFIDEFKLENNDDVVISYSGSRVTIKPDGVFNINTTKDVNINAAKTLNIETGDNTNIKAKGSVNVTSEKDTNVQAKQDVNVEAAENINLVSDKVTNITATEDINITTDKVLNITAAADINVSSANITIENEENITINTKNSVVNATETVTVNANEINLTAGDDTNPQNVNINGNLNVSEKLNVKKGIKNEGGGIVNIATGAEILPSINLGEGITNHGLLPTDGFTNNKGIVNSGGISNVKNVTLGQVTSIEEAGISNSTGSIKNLGALGIINELGGIKNLGILNNVGEVLVEGGVNVVGTVEIEGATNIVGLVDIAGDLNTVGITNLGGDTNVVGLLTINGVPIPI